ncbi:unnamed protein product [Vitrella brassicaformis CCMP3155]|uniref:Uncharacterized protein n=1 Tax=Vitrella brassicaformis (strain CCMP3155) TaxID=1169540 RepID=A0A0G4H4S8_VITBC|nr:unnamed protein product [Vitrella brassicaformis CCMP3155]|eukprot:CEM38556.1 unnamed protein product [Vitrella brassicaformis CCMP3155]
MHETFAHDSTAIIGRLPPNQARAAERARCNDTGQFMTVRPSQLDDTDLSALELRDAMCHRYGLPHQDVPDKCDGELPKGARSGADFTVQHALGCSLGGLVYAKDDRLKHEVGGLCQLAGLKVAYEHTVWKETAHAAAARDPRAAPLGVTPCDGPSHPHPPPLPDPPDHPDPPDPHTALDEPDGVHNNPSVRTDLFVSRFWPGGRELSIAATRAKPPARSPARGRS